MMAHSTAVLIRIPQSEAGMYLPYLGTLGASLTMRNTSTMWTSMRPISPLSMKTASSAPARRELVWVALSKTMSHAAGTSRMMSGACT